MTSLNNFFNNFLAIQDVAKANAVLIYFKEKASDQINKQKVDDLIEYLDKKAQGKVQAKPNAVQALAQSPIGYLKSADGHQN